MQETLIFKREGYYPILAGDDFIISAMRLAYAKSKEELEEEIKVYKVRPGTVLSINKSGQLDSAANKNEWELVKTMKLSSYRRYLMQALKLEEKEEDKNLASGLKNFFEMPTVIKFKNGLTMIVSPEFYRELDTAILENGTDGATLYLIGGEDWSVDAHGNIFGLKDTNSSPIGEPVIGEVQKWMRDCVHMRDYVAQ